LAHPDVLQFYFERVAGRGLQALWDAERAFELLTDKEALDAHVRSFEPAEWSGIIHALEAFEGDFPVEAAVPTTVVLLNLLDEMPERPRGIFDFFDETTIVTRIVLRALRCLLDADAVEAAVRSAMPQITTLSGKLQLLNFVGYDEGAGHQMIDRAASKELEAKFREQVRTEFPEYLAKERELFRLLTWCKRSAEPFDSALPALSRPPLACAALKAAVGQVRSQGMGTRSIQIEKVLHWESLVDLAGGEDRVQQMIDVCDGESDDDELREARELATRYLAGWRPEDDRYARH
jgi:hypothetical protein